VTALYHEIEPASLIKVTDTAVTFDPLQRGTERPGQELLQSLYAADIDYEFYDVNRGRCKQPLLFYAGGDWLTRAAQEHLKEYVESGGHLICVGAYPRLDDSLHPLNLLGIKEPAGIVGGSPNNLWLEVLGRKVKSPWAFNYAEVPGTPIVASRLAPGGQTAEELSLQIGLQAGAEYTIGYTEARGRGCLTVIGLASSPDLLLMLHDHLKLPIPSRSRTSQVSTALFHRGEDFYLFAVNNGNEDKVAEVALDSNLLQTPCWQVRNLVSGQTWTLNLRESDRLTFSVPRKDGTIIHLRGALV
jgi:hypothetical protein